MIDQTATFDVCLDFLDNWSDNGDYYGLSLYNSQEILVGQKDFTLLFIGSGNFPLVSYSIEKPLKTRGFDLLSKYKDMLEVHLEGWIPVY